MIFNLTLSEEASLGELTNIRIGADGTVYPSAGDAVRGQVTDLREDSTLKEWNGFVFPDNERIFEIEQRALKSNDIELYDLIHFNADHALSSSTGEYMEYVGYYATEEYYLLPRNIIVKNLTVWDNRKTITIYKYNSSKTYISNEQITYEQEAEITLDGNTYIRINVNGDPSEIMNVTCNVHGLLFNELDSSIDEIEQNLQLSFSGNGITEVESGYVTLAGVVGASTSYVHTNKIPVYAGQTLSFWNEVSGNMANTEVRYLTAYDGSGSAVPANGREYASAYVVPSGITSIVATFWADQSNIMVVSGITKPNAYTNQQISGYISGDMFAQASATNFMQKVRSNDELKSGIKYYLDRKRAVCYCIPNNLTSAKINIFFNGNEATTGSSACFVDFANGTFGFYKPYGIYNASSLVIDTSSAISLTLDVTHEYCIDYERHATSDAYTLKITDMMTLESDSFNTDNGGNGWGIIGYDATAVTVNDFKRLCPSTKNPTILILGDSYTEANTIWGDRDKRWCYLLGEAVGSYAINGQGGARSEYIETWIDDYLFDVFNPKYVIVETGTNEQSYTQYARNMPDIIAKIKAIGAIPILCTVPVTDTKPNPSDYNTFVLNSGLPYIDIARALTVNGNRTTQNLDLFLADKIHPNIDGHQKIYEMAKLNLPFIFRNITV